MYGLLITFDSTIAGADLDVSFARYAEALREVPGLLSKAWLQDGNTFGGFHLFASKETADAYLASDLARGLMATEGFDRFDARGFEVLDGFSAVTGLRDLPPLST